DLDNALAAHAALGLAEGMEGFCWGVAAGAFVGSLLLPYLAVRAGGLRFIPALSHPMMGRFLLMALPLMIGQSVVVLDEQFVRIFGSMAGDGAVSLLNYARRIMLVPVGVVAQAAGVASFPFLASLAAKGDMEAFRGTLGGTMRSSMVIAVPVTVWMVIAAEPVMGFIFEGGGPSRAETAGTAPLRMLMMLAVPFWLLQQVTGRAFYAMQDTVTPAVVGTLVTAAAVPLYIAAVPAAGAAGVAAATTLSIALYSAVLMAVACRKWAAGAFAGVGGAAWRSAALCVPGAAAAYCVQSFGAPLAEGLHPLLAQGIVLAVGGSLFGLLWLACAKLFQPGYFEIAAAPVLRRMRRKKG
ncbi:MAG: murein biosynthesis integral membrane protein MurJ, partial [Mailhella sp.]|nr:murein biosynthesis integral membrane protein MurJ [Mailhella sp.]